MPYKDKDKKRENNRKWYWLNREKRLISLKAWNDRKRDSKPKKLVVYSTGALTKEEHKKIIKERYLELNREKIRAKERIRYKDNINSRIAKRLRSRLYDALKGGFKTGSAITNLGCTLDEFKVYLENLFEGGMSWSNYTQFGWHIDHKIPMSKFDLTKLEEIKKACHYSNLQPMWWRDNLIKQDKVR